MLLCFPLNKMLITKHNILAIMIQAITNFASDGIPLNTILEMYVLSKVLACNPIRSHETFYSGST